MSMRMCFMAQFEAWMQIQASLIIELASPLFSLLIYFKKIFVAVKPIKFAMRTPLEKNM